jgi:cytoskeletal protein RodZ
MKVTTAGELLKEARIRKKLSLDSVEKATKIRKKIYYCT